MGRNMFTAVLLFVNAFFKSETLTTTYFCRLNSLQQYLDKLFKYTITEILQSCVHEHETSYIYLKSNLLNSKHVIMDIINLRYKQRIES